MTDKTTTGMPPQQGDLFGAKAPHQPALFDERFVDRHAGQIITDPITAIVELVANCWDAGATKVYIEWPNQASSKPFSITDNGIGLTKDNFVKVWRTIDYDRVRANGGSDVVIFQPDLNVTSKRRAFGRNGRGRYASFYFCRSYTVKTVCGGHEATFKVERGLNEPFKIELTSHVPKAGHRTTILADAPTDGVLLPAATVRAAIGQRFLVDPDFDVYVDGTRIEFDDISKGLTMSETLAIGDVTVELRLIDQERASRTTQQHGIAWRVKNRLVGEPSWHGFNDRSLLDGRKTEAKRYTFIVFADCLETSVLHDWTGFIPGSAEWQTVGNAVHERIGQLLMNIATSRLQAARANVVAKNRGALRRMAPIERAKWSTFVDEVIRACPSLSENNLEQIAGILAKLEVSDSQYALIEQLHMLRPGELDAMNSIMEKWTVKMAELVLNTIQQRMLLIRELRSASENKSADEVHELMPLVADGLWMFGAEFESIEFTVNRGMTTVMRDLLKANVDGSRNRPDFVILPNSLIGCYSRPDYDASNSEVWPATVVIVELKAPDVPITGNERMQVEGYYYELMNRGAIARSTKVHAFLIGGTINGGFLRTTDSENYHMSILLYTDLIKRAENRMMRLHEKIISAPFISGSKLEAFVQSGIAGQMELGENDDGLAPTASPTMPPAPATP